MVYFVYILKCITPNEKYYFYRGYSNDIYRRYFEHKRGYSKYTSRYKGNVQIIYLEEIIDRSKKIEKARAIKREKEIKKWSREKIDRLIQLRRPQLQRLIEKYFQPNIYFSS